MYNPTETIRLIKAKDSRILKWLYDNHRTTFVSWALRNFSISEEEAVDTFQESVIVLYQNVMEGKLTKLNCAVKTYLFSVGKNILLKKHRSKIPTQNIEEADNVNGFWSMYFIENILLSQLQKN